MLYQTENPHGGDIYETPVLLDFSANIHPLGTPAAVKRAVAESVEQLDRYPDPFCRELTAAIADDEGVPSGQILCGGGAAELIFSFCAAVKPKRALMPVPTFSEYQNALRQRCCEVVELVTQSHDAFRLDEGFLREIQNARPDAVFLCNPNNPTGRLIEPALLLRIVELCEDMGCRLFVDECFLPLSDGWERASLKPLLAQHPSLFLLKAFTKSFGMAGLRLGYCLCGDEALLKRMAAAVQPWNVSLPAQRAGVAALGEKDFIPAGREIIRKERPWMEESLRQMGFTVIPSQANFILFSGEQGLRERLLPHGILIRDCGNYSGLEKGWYRIAVRRQEQNRALMAALAAVKRGG